MARPRGAKTLELSADDDRELLALCADNHDAEKKWLGGVFLRYGMKHSGLALADQGRTSAQRSRKRRALQQTADELAAQVSLEGGTER